MLPSSRLHRLLLGGAAAGVLVLLAAAAFPSQVYNQVVWKYFIGPVVADAANTATVQMDGVTAHRGYTLVSEAVYGLLLVYGLAVLVEGFRELDIGGERSFVLWFVPFIAFGALLRVVEDAAVMDGAARFLLISPVIYAAVGVAAMLVTWSGVVLQRRGVTDDYRRVVAAAGTLGAIGAAVLLASTTTATAAWMLPVTLAGAAGMTAVVVAVARYVQAVWDGLSAVVSWEGATVVAGHMLDGVATAVSIDVLGYGEKHPVTEFIIQTTGTAYSFPVVKAGAVLAILGVLYGADRDDDPLFFNLVLLGILAVGLGPGVRNLARAVLGV